MRIDEKVRQVTNKRLVSLEYGFIHLGVLVDELREQVLAATPHLPPQTVILTNRGLRMVREQLDALLAKIDEPITQRIQEPV